MPYVLHLFNFVLNCGIFPDAWSDGLLVPLHKKGNVNVPDNYRGITLLSVLGKLFTRVLNNRLMNWAESYGVLVEAQNGFRPKRGTVDGIFILHNVINKFLDEGNSLYSFFVDYSKAFDFVVHDNLWYKLLSCGVSGKIFNVIRSMYSTIKTKVFSNGIVSDPYFSYLGVRQGECLSPFLFSMYLNDLEEYLSSPNAGITVGHFRLLLLLYADDVVVFADNREELQDEIDKLCEYCKRWKLRLNTSKSKVVVFKRGNSRTVHTWKYGNEEIQNIFTIPYLGVTFSSNGLFTQAQCKLADQANKSLFLLYKKLDSFKDLKPSVAIDLFDKYISPVLSYGSEVWGFHKAPEIEQVQLNFCKRLLRVKRTTQNDFVYGELGRYPMYIFRYIRIIKYWLKIISGQKSHYVSLLYNDSLANIDRNTRYGWSRKVRSLLFSCGFGEPWYNQGVGDIDWFCAVFKTRLSDMFQQEWHGRICDSTRATFYRTFKDQITFSPYLDGVSSKLYRISLSRLRTSSHRLGIETGRWRRPVLPREQRKCPRCDKIDDEYHFLLECCILKDLRTQLIPAYYWKRPSMFKCIQLLNSSDKTLNKLAKYVHRGFMLKSWIAMLVTIFGLPWFTCMLCCMYSVLLYRL